MGVLIPKLWRSGFDRCGGIGLRSMVILTLVESHSTREGPVLRGP